MSIAESSADRGGHDGGIWSPVACRIVATWPVGSFAEILAVRSDGSICIALYSESRIDCYEPATGATRRFAELTAPAMGLVTTPDDTL